MSCTRKACYQIAPFLFFFFFYCQITESATNQTTFKAYEIFSSSHYSRNNPTFIWEIKSIMKCLTFPTERKTFLCLHFCLNFQSPLCFYSRFGYVTLTADLHVHQEAWFYFNLFMERLVIRLERVIDPRCSKHWAWPTLLSQLWIQFSDGSENYRGWHTALTRTLLNVAQLTVWVCFPQVELPHCPHPHSHGNKIPDYWRVIVNKNKPEKQKTE